MRKIDLKSRHKALYTASATAIAEVTAPPLRYLMIDGAGDPNTAPEYTAAVQALFSLAYALKFAFKKAPDGFDYGVMPLEGLWWVQDPADFSYTERSGWRWTAMILQPNAITAEAVAAQQVAVAKKKDLPALARVRLAELNEGRALQILHKGPYADEPSTIERLHNEIAARGLRLTGRHHEIYLSDVSRTAPEKLRTIIRQPVAAA